MEIGDGIFKSSLIFPGEFIWLSVKGLILLMLKGAVRETVHAQWEEPMSVTVVGTILTFVVSTRALCPCVGHIESLSNLFILMVLQMVD